MEVRRRWDGYFLYFGLTGGGELLLYYTIYTQCTPFTSLGAEEIGVVNGLSRGCGKCELFLEWDPYLCTTTQ
jgi:hypothetical protein